MGRVSDIATRHFADAYYAAMMREQLAASAKLADWFGAVCTRRGRHTLVAPAWKFTGCKAKTMVISAVPCLLRADDFGETPLHFCLSYLSTASEALAPWDSYQHIFESVGVLLRSGADTSLRNPAGLTPLIRAADEPQPLGPELTAMVLSFTPDVEATDKKGRTALDRAVCHGK